MPKGYSKYNLGGWHHSEASKELVRQARLGKPLSEVHKQSLRGPRWAYHTEEFKQKLSIRMFGSGNPMYGIPMSEEAKEKARAKLRVTSGGESNGMYGRIGANHPNWKGGIAYLPYAIEFNDKLKEQIRIRDNHTCQECGASQKEYLVPLPIHHIDYAKLYSAEINLITLCKICHGKTNYDRQYWQRHFEEKIAKIYAAKGGDLVKC